MLTYEDIRHNPDINALIEAGNHALGVIGFTDHGYGHAGLVSKVAGDLLQTLGYNERTCELARIAGYMHDIGNAVNRSNHAMSGALLAFNLLRELNMEIHETVDIMTAIGNHDESTAAAVTPLSAALILADKSDVRRSRVRTDRKEFDIHDRVNYAVVDSSLVVQKEQKIISLGLKIDTTNCPVMDYFTIFLTRMTLCRSAAAFLGMDFELIINETRML
jgi:metal-dependent HD superfamily phosphatase/phosphodiesterase